MRQLTEDEASSPNSWGTSGCSLSEGVWVDFACTFLITPRHYENQFFYVFLKVHKELGNATKFGTSRPLFS